jgi:hypothetical protein
VLSLVLSAALALAAAGVAADGPACAPLLAELRSRRDEIAGVLAESRGALLRRAEREEPALAARLAAVPPTPRPRGYGILPELRPDPPEREVPPAETRYALADLEGWTGAALRGARGLAAAAAGGGPDRLEELVARYEALAARRATLDAHLSYHEEWQRVVLEWPDYFARQNALAAKAREMRRLREAGAREEAARAEEELRREIGPFLPAPGLRARRAPGGRLVLPVTVATDIRDEAFLREFEAAVRRAFAGSPAARNGRLRVALEWRRLAPEALYPEGVPAGRILEAGDHLRRFPAGSPVLTTGAASTHSLPGRYVQLGAEPLTRRELAHEFAHLLGFTDGYLRAFEGDPAGPRGVVLVEWRGLQDDLMGSPSEGRVTPAMVRALRSAYGPGAPSPR